MRWPGCLAVVGCTLLASIAGCEFGQGTTGGAGSTGGSTPPVGAVGVVDLDAVARHLGRDEQISSAIRQRQASLNEQLATVKTSYEEEIAQKQRQFGASPSAEQSQLLANIQRQVGTSLNEIRRRAQKNLAVHRVQLVQDFREEARPFVQQVARERGLSVIVTKNDSVVFDYEAAADITGEVAKRMAARQPSGAAAPAERTASRPAPPRR